MFDDLIGLPPRPLRRDVDARTKRQTMFGHVLVDGYRDTNPVQQGLLPLLVSGDGPRWRGLLTAVAADDPGIHGWRAAILAQCSSLWGT